HQIDDHRDLALKISPQCSRQDGVPPVESDESSGEDEVRDRRQQQDRAIECDRPSGKLILAEPAGDEGDKRQPEQQMQICPQHPSIHLLDRLEQVMVVVPVDAEKNKTQHIDRKSTRLNSSHVSISYAVFCL